MWKRIFILAVLIISVFSVFPQDIKIIQINGTVKVKQNEKADWINAQVGQKLKTGQFIFTGFKSSAVIQAVNAKIEVKPLSQLMIASLLEEKDNITTDVHLNYGKLKATVDKEPDKKVFFKVRSANSTASVRGTVFTFGGDELVVDEGTVEVINSFDNSILVQKNESAYIPPTIDFMNDPYFNILDQYESGIKLIGLSDSESFGNIDIMNSNGSGSHLSYGTVVINITIKK